MQSFALPLGCYSNSYNCQRCHLANGYLAPLVYEQALITGDALGWFGRFTPALRPVLIFPAPIVANLNFVGRPRPHLKTGFHLHACSSFWFASCTRCICPGGSLGGMVAHVNKKLVPLYGANNAFRLSAVSFKGGFRDNPQCISGGESDV